MQKFKIEDYLELGENQLVKLRINGYDTQVYACKIFRPVLQAYQPSFTPINKIELLIVRDLERFKENKELDENFYTITVDPSDVEQSELVEISY